MGMTDSQFKGYVRLLIKALNEVKVEVENQKTTIKLDEVLKDLQATLED